MEENFFKESNPEELARCITKFLDIDIAQKKYDYSQNIHKCGNVFINILDSINNK
jgi:hypothetical protein